VKGWMMERLEKAKLECQVGGGRKKVTLRVIGLGLHRPVEEYEVRESSIED